MTRTKLPCMMLLALVAATALVPTASAQEREEDTRWREETRFLDLDQSADQVRFLSERSTGTGDDRIDVTYQRDTGRVEYAFSSFDENGEGSRLTFIVHIDALVEFRDPTGRARYDLEAETAERYPLQALEPAPLSSTSILQGRGYQANAEYTIPDRSDEDGPLGGTGLGDGTLRIALIMVETPRTVEGERLSPTQLMFDVHVEDHPFTATDTRLALETRVTATRTTSLATNETHAITQQTDALESRFTWSPTATISGVSRDIHTTLLSYPEDDEGSQATFMAAYPQDDDIRHTWTLGTQRFKDIPSEVLDAITRGDPLVFTTAAVATLALAGWPAVQRLRRR